MTGQLETTASIRRLSPPADVGADLAADTLQGLTSSPKQLSSKYFYDARGSELFEDITRLPEYYLTRAEAEILTLFADEIMEAIKPQELVELGSGYSVKTRLLLDALHRAGSGDLYVPFDISEAAIRDASTTLTEQYPWLTIAGLVGDFPADLPKVPHSGRRLVTFLGSTIGNFRSPDRVAFYRSVSAMLEPDDGLLVGIDLVKDVDTLLAAYNDSAGVTAEFNKNILHVLNRELGANFPVEEFEYVVRWDPVDECVAMGLRATRAIDVTIDTLDLAIHLDEGEEIHDEVSCKFRKEVVTSEALAAGLKVSGWWTDTRNRFAVALLQPAATTTRRPWKLHRPHH
jgi:L-histidine Nalpha-methyltransferase